MPETERGGDHPARIASLFAFEAAITANVEAGLAVLGTLNDPVRIHSAMQLLVLNGRFQDAVDLAASHKPHCKWLDLAVYAHVALRDIEPAKELLDLACKSCEPGWVSDRCRISVADAVFGEVLQDTLGANLVTTVGLSEEDRSLLEFVVEALNPLVEPVRLLGRIEGAIQRFAVEFVANAYGLLGQLSQIAELVRPMIDCRPVPLLLAQLTLRKVCEPPNGLPGRLRVEYPDSFSARFLAAILDRDIYNRPQEAFKSQIGLQNMARDNGAEAIEQLCRGLFETASGIDLATLARARRVVDTLLGASNSFQLYFDTVAFLFQDRPDAALAEINADPRVEEAIWWQLKAQAYELSKDLAKAAECWDNACQLVPHPDLLNRFAGLSIQQHRFEDAVRALKSAVTRSPEDPRILEQLAFAHTRLREFSEATAIFAQLAQIQPNVTRYRTNLALCQARSGDPSSALISIDTAVDFSHPDLQVFGLRTEILRSLGRVKDAFSDLNRVRDVFWGEVRFLVLYMDTAYRAGEDKAADSAFQQLMKMQHNGQLPEPLFHPVSLEDFKRMGIERFRHRDSLFSEIVRGKLPWLVAEALMGAVSDQAWHKRTQRLRWLPDGVSERGEWTIYATNGFSVQKDANEHRAVLRIGVPRSGESVVVDMSAIITLHHLGRLTKAADYFGKLVLPASYGDFPVQDAPRLTPNQPSREQDLRSIHDLVQRRMITVLEEGELTEDIPLVDEYNTDNEIQCFALADVAQVLRAAQRLTSEEIAEFTHTSRRAMRSDLELPRDKRVLFATSTLRAMVRYEWIERVLPTVKWCVSRTDYDKEIHELLEYDFQRKILSSHHAMWNEINQLRTSGKLEYRDSPSCRRDRADDSDDDVALPPFLDAVFVADDLGLRLLADDRFCQAAALNQRPELSDAAFGTDRLILALENSNVLTADEVCSDLIRMMRWRYRFLLPDPRHLQILARRSSDNLPGPELREIAAYVQDSMRDPGLFSGAEKADLPISVAFKYFMGWKELCIQFLGLLWEDPNFSPEQLDTVTKWCVQSLLPAVPRTMHYSTVGRRLASFTPKAFMLSAMIRFATVQPIQRANEALRLMACQLGMTENEFYEVAADAAGDSYD